MAYSFAAYDGVVNGIQTRRGAVLLWRLGTLEHGEQSAWDRAPAKKGLWAFPYPFWDASFVEHQYTYLLPARLRTNKHYAPEDSSWFRYADGTAVAAEDLHLDDEGWPESMDIDVAEDFWTARTTWMNTVGKRVLPVRRFWYTGDVFTHFPRTGLACTDGHADWSQISTWYRTDAVEAARRAKKASGQLARRSEHDYRISRRDAGLMELFLPAGAGRIS